MLEGVLAPRRHGLGGGGPRLQARGQDRHGQQGRPATGGYSKTNYVASFVGFAPARNPQLLVAVMVDEPQGDIYGGRVAAPAFEKIVAFALPYLRIPPQLDRQRPD